MCLLITGNATVGLSGNLISVGQACVDQVPESLGANNTGSVWVFSAPDSYPTAIAQ